MKQRTTRVVAVLLAMIFTLPALAVCYPEYESCGYELMEWFALNYPDVYDNPRPGGPDDPNTVFCAARINDALGRPAEGVRINLNINGTAAQQTGKNAYTNANGYAVVGMTVPPSFEAHYTNCRAFILDDAGDWVTAGPHDSHGSLSEPNVRLPRWVGLEIGYLAPGVPGIDDAQPDRVEYLRGIEGGYSSSSLYLAGDYDRPVIFVPPFAPSEPSALRLLLEIQDMALAFQQQGIDLWVFRPWSTRQNVHEQSAELAQAIRRAAEYAGGPSDGKVAVMGFSAGGLSARIALARWEDPDEGAWRSSLGLTAYGTEPPVSLLAMLDTPNRGAHASLELQKAANASGLATGLDTCAAVQMLRKSCRRYRDHDVSGAERMFDHCTSDWAHSFFDVGNVDLVFDDDWIDPAPASLLCKGGPAVSTLNGDGYPHTMPVIATSHGQVGLRNRCYGTGGSPLDANFEGQNLCANANQAGQIDVLDEYIRVDVAILPDPVVRFFEWDLVPGSRFDLAVGGTEIPIPLFPDIMIEQKGSATFVPLTSAFDVRSCNPFTTVHPLSGGSCMPTAYDEAQGGLLDRHPAIAETRANDFMSTHLRQPDSIRDWIVTRIDEELGPLAENGNGEGSGTDGSCEDRCGQSSGSCYCDTMCEEYDDCCSDYVVVDPQPGEFAGCRPAPVCGDDTCDAFSGLESESTCCDDCGSGCTVCGNGTCEAGENSANCATDCGGGSSCTKLCFTQE